MRREVGLLLSVSLEIIIDDGPTGQTDSALQELKKQNLLATFFVVGSNALVNPKPLLDAHNAGHQIGIHTWSHSHLVFNSELIDI